MEATLSPRVDPNPLRLEGRFELRHYLLDRGSTVGEIQALVPFNLRPLDQPAKPSEIVEQMERELAVCGTGRPPAHMAGGV